MAREVLNYDVVIVGAGPAGLATAIQLRQLSQNAELSIAILDKGSSIGANIISGCVMDPRGLTELIPNWRELNFPSMTPVTSERMLYLTANNKFRLPIPRQWNNAGNYIISLSQLCQVLSVYAESLGVEVYPGFAAVAPIIEDNQVVGVITGDVGIDRAGKHTANYQQGIELRARQVVVAEGCRGSLAKQIIKRFALDKDASPQTYGLGIKEIWQVDANKSIPGSVIHCLGYPLNKQAYGGGFLYHQDNNLVSVGLVTALDYSNPYLNPYEEFQKFKQHPAIRRTLEGGKRIEYGARTVVEGGIQALPKLSFPGGVLVGDSAGFLNVAKIKGVHNAIKSGILAAQAVSDAINSNQPLAASYQPLVLNSWLYQDLYKVRNIRPGFKLGLYPGIIYAAIDNYLFRGHTPWTFKSKIPDNKRLKKATPDQVINYPKHDGVYSFDQSSSVHLANISHDENQPCHLHLANKTIPIQVNLEQYRAPETRYCPAGVYEILQGKDGKPALHINAQNCVHCKACDIKDPTQNINWVPPESGSGPQYSEM